MGGNWAIQGPCTVTDTGPFRPPWVDAALVDYGVLYMGDLYGNRYRSVAAPGRQRGASGGFLRPSDRYCVEYTQIRPLWRERAYSRRNFVRYVATPRRTKCPGVGMGFSEYGPSFFKKENEKLRH